MKLIFKVKSAMQVNDGKTLVQLAGKHGHVSLDLPLGHKISVGDEFILEGDVVSLMPIDEVAQRGLIAHLSAPVYESPIPKTAPGLMPPPKRNE